MVVKILIRIILYYYMIYKALMMCFKVKSNKVPIDLVYSNCLLKMLILHLQFLKSYLTFPFLFPPIMLEIFNFVSFSISSGADKVLNLECLIELPKGYFSYVYCIISIVSPLVVATSLMVFIKNRKFFNTSNINSKNAKFPLFFNKLMFLPYLYVISLMVSYDEILGLLISNFSSINISDDSTPAYHLVNRFETRIDSDIHQNWMFVFALPLTVCVGLGIPFFIFYRIWRANKEGKVNSEEVLLKFGYFFFAFGDNNKLYEAVYIFRKIFLIFMHTFFISVLSLSKIYDPSSFSMIICSFYTGLSYMLSVLKPYNNNRYPILNQMEKITVTAQALTTWCGTLVLSFEYNNKSKVFVDYLAIILLFIGCFINIFVFFIWILYYWKMSMKTKLVNILKKIRSKLVKKLTNKKQHLLDSSTKTKIKSLNKEEEEEVPSINEEFENNKSLPLYNNLKSYQREINNRQMPTAHTDQKFYQVVDLNNDSQSSQILSLWDFFQRSDSEGYPSWASMVQGNSDGKIFIKKSSKNISKSLLPSLLAIDLVFELSLSDFEKVKVRIEKNPGFLISISKEEFNDKESLLTVNLLVSYVDFQRLKFKNTIIISLMIENNLSKNCFSENIVELQVFAFEFLQRPNKKDLEKIALFQIPCQGLYFSWEGMLGRAQVFKYNLKFNFIVGRYISDSDILNLRLPREDLNIQVIRTTLAISQNENKDLFLYREFKSVNDNYTGKSSCLNILNFTNQL